MCFSEGNSPFLSFLAELSVRGKGKRRAELLKLCQNAAEMKQQRLGEVVESFDRVLEEKLQTNEGLRPNSDTLRSWSASCELRVYPNSHLPTCIATWSGKTTTQLRTSGRLKAYMDTSCSMMDTWKIYSAVDWKTNRFLTFSLK